MPTTSSTVWEIELTPRNLDGDPDYRRLLHDVGQLAPWIKQRFHQPVPSFTTTRGFLLDGPVSKEQADRLALELFADPVAQSAIVRPAYETRWPDHVVTVMRKPGVMDPVSDSVEETMTLFDIAGVRVRTFQRTSFAPDTSPEVIGLVASKVLANEAIDQIIRGPLDARHLGRGSTQEFVKVTVPMRGIGDDALVRLSKEGQLYLDLAEMRTIRDYFQSIGRDPTDIELESIAQTWSEHCSHKTLRSPYEFNGEVHPAGILKDTIMHATRSVDRDWCVRVFSDNAGIVRFNDEWNVSFKVETHNHPSAIEPYGGANTGIGGVIRDILGAGRGGKPICNTNVFCVAPTDTPHADLPPGTLHPERVLRGMVSGVRDYGNRMGIPTVNGAVFVDPRYLGNPLVYCGTVGKMPANASFGDAHAGDLIVAVGGRTGRDGIHGATFSSGELTHESETASSGAVQIGNAITEKKVLDLILAARDQGLFRAVTDCGAGGFSSAVGEMGEKIGARVQLESAPLKYEGLTYTEIWISEAQERMVLAVPPEHWHPLHQLAQSEGVEAFVLGVFEPTGRLTLTYQGETVGDLSMDFLHNGRPNVVRKAVFEEETQPPFELPSDLPDAADVIERILGSMNVCSKEWIIRQYDHEVQGTSVIKPLVGVHDRGPSDAAVLQPILTSNQGLAIACGMNPRFGDLDPYRMALSAVDEAIRNVVAVGGDPDRTSLLDNFCWGRTERPEVLGSLVRAAHGCRDAAIAYRCPFISGKDSLNNEYQTEDQRITIPPSLLVSAMSIVPDHRQAVTMDLKTDGHALILVGQTRNEMGGSHFNLVTGAVGGEPPGLDLSVGPALYTAVHRLIREGFVRSCHDLSEGGLAVAIAEMAFAGDLGATIDLDAVPTDEPLNPWARLFSESNARLVLEVAVDQVREVFQQLEGLPSAIIGEVTLDPVLIVRSGGKEFLRRPVEEFERAWRAPMAW